MRTIWLIFLLSHFNAITSYRLTNLITRNVVQNKLTEIYSQSKLQKRKDLLSGRTLPGDNEPDTPMQRQIRKALEKSCEKDSTLRFGDQLSGSVIELDEYGAYVEVGGKYSGFLPLEEATLNPDVQHISDILEIGQEVTAEIIGTMKGRPVLSLRSVMVAQAWDKINKYKEEDTVVEVEIVEANQSGATCLLEGLTVFLPGSQIVGVADEAMEGTRVQVKVLDVDVEEGKIVVSQRKVVGDLTFDFERGHVVSGNVTGIRPYGVFIEVVGGATGLLHISHISAELVENVESLFSIGQEVRAMVYEVDKGTGKLAFSTKALEASPGEMLRDMTAVFNNAEENARKYMEKLENERLAREAAAKDIVAGLGGELTLDGSNPDSILSVADSIENILASITGDNRKF